MTSRSDGRQIGKIVMVVSVLLLIMMVLPFSAKVVEASQQQNVVFYHCLKNTPVWSEPSAQSSRVGTMKKGDFVPVVAITKNGSGNLWMQTLDGTYVFSGNLGPVLYSAKTNIPVWSQASSKSTKLTTLKTKGAPVRIIRSLTNNANNKWYETDQGFIFSGNLSNDRLPLIFRYTKLSPVLYRTVKSSVPIWQAPYSASSRIATLGNANFMVINGQLTNSYGNLWFRTSEGAWIYSSNVEMQKPDAANVLVTQSISGKCTLAAAATMLRRQAILKLDPQWQSITENTLQRDAWVQEGLRSDFTHRGVRVQRHSFDGDLQSRKQQLLQLLDRHPEGIVIFGRYDNGAEPHAVALIGYNASRDQFIVLDPSRSRSNKPMTLTEAFFAGRSHDDRINNIRFIWTITR